MFPPYAASERPNVLSQAANANNAVFVVVRNKARSTHLNEVVAKSSGNIHVLEADVVDHRALKVWPPY